MSIVQLKVCADWSIEMQAWFQRCCKGRLTSHLK